MELSVPRLLQFMIDDGIRPRQMDIILQGALWMFVAAMIGAMSTLGQGYCRAVVSQGLAFDIRHTLFKHIQSLSFANLDQMQTGRLMTRVSSDVDVVRMFSSAGLALLLRVLLMILGSMFMLLLTDWQLSLIMFAVAGISAVFIRHLMLQATRLFTSVQSRLGALNTLVQENLAGIQVVKAFVRGRFEIDQFAESNQDYREKNIEVGELMAVAMPVLQVLTNVGTVAVLWFGGISVIGDRLTLGELIAFNNYLLIGMGPLPLPRQSANDGGACRSLCRARSGSAGYATGAAGFCGATHSRIAARRSCFRPRLFPLQPPRHEPGQWRG